jgi:hypothetical protein
MYDESNKKIHLTDDGEVWSIPDPQAIKDERQFQGEAASTRAQIAAELQATREHEMAKLITQLIELNIVAQNKIFFAVEDKREKKVALITRKFYVFEVDANVSEGVYLIISAHGFYVLRFPLVNDGYGLPGYDEKHKLTLILDPDKKIAIKYASIGFSTHLARFSIDGELNGENLSYTTQNQRDEIPLATAEDEALIQACLDHSLAVLQTDSQKIEAQAIKEEGDIAALRKQVGMTTRIRGMLPIEVDKSQESASWWKRILEKKKKRR